MSLRSIHFGVLLFVTICGWMGCRSKPEPTISSMLPHQTNDSILSEDNEFRVKSAEPSFLGKVGDKLQSMVSRSATDETEQDRGKPLPRTDEKTSQLAKARLAERHGENEQAETLYNELLKRFPDEASIYHRLGILAAQKGKLEEANHLLLQATRRSPQNVQALSDLGYLYYLQDRLGEAEQVLRHALAQQPQHAAANNNLAIVLGGQRKYAECLATFRRVGNDAQAHANLAYIFAQQGDFERAKEGYLHALKLDNTLKPAANALLQIVEREKLVKEVELARNQKRQQTQVASRESGVPAHRNRQTEQNDASEYLSEFTPSRGTEYHPDRRDSSLERLPSQTLHRNVSAVNHPSENQATRTAQFDRNPSDPRNSAVRTGYERPAAPRQARDHASR
jgi:Flp pilus assembly protein TadD